MLMGGAQLPAVVSLTLPVGYSPEMGVATASAHRISALLGKYKMGLTRLCASSFIKDLR